ncbi:phage holin family protein [Gracilibacillus sp. YIM 98692]|uniref:phage holin family protein n=1 Tax=Gracilibacillus sp. YIM 98692 TaxID=2663532 RepID=UPI0013D07544|nr:phage holin family protein [Gracilibacillus sp. YIM 98692]
MMTEYLELINDEFYFVIPALWIIGYACKRTPFLPDWLIIWILLCIGVLASCSLFGWSIKAIVDGIIAAGIAVFGHQMVKQTIFRKGS